jgi:rubrerythrin
MSDYEEQQEEARFEEWNERTKGGTQTADTVLICNRCGGEAGRKGDDAVDWCDDCGVVEGNTHYEPVD